MHQILIIVNKDRLLNKADVGWYGSANFAGKLFDSVHLFPLKGCFKDFPVIKYTYVACFQVTMWFVFALNGCNAWKVSKYGNFSGPYFPAFWLNTERHSVSLRIQSECRKIRTRKNSVFGHFSSSGDCFYGLLDKTYLELFQTSKRKFVVQIVTSKEITSLLRHWKGFRMGLCWM